VSLKVTGVNHAQVNVPSADLERARAFYVDFLGMTQVPRPPAFKSAGIWLNAGSFELHIGVEDGIERKTRAHLAYDVKDIRAWRKRVINMGGNITEQPKIPDYERFHFRDPFGNNIELIERTNK
jgi:catechol 2,3-dioxygenase-like lactoylglutathione lyase family enzyme